jgi:hypothetical protein
MATISYEQLTPAGLNGVHTPHDFITEASDIGLPPGTWPEQLDVVDIGNNLPLRIASRDETGAVYKQIAGCVVVKVFND